MRCPRCDGRKLRIGVVLTGAVTCRFGGDDPVAVLETSEFTSYWHPEAACDCVACRWSGTVTDAAVSEADLEHVGPYLTSELDWIEKELDEGTCPEVLTPAIRSLLRSARQLQVLIEVTERANRCWRPLDASLNEAVAV